MPNIAVPGGEHRLVLVAVHVPGVRGAQVAEGEDPPVARDVGVRQQLPADAPRHGVPVAERAGHPLGTDRHGCQALALEDTEVCVLPFDRLEHLAQNVAALQRNLYQLLSKEISRDQNIMLLLGSMRAEERLAVFLINLSDRYRRRGYSSTEFVLRMTREEIGSYLGLKLETVGRLFSRFQEEGLIQVQGRAVKLLDPTALKQLIGQRG